MYEIPSWIHFLNKLTVDCLNTELKMTVKNYVCFVFLNMDSKRYWPLQPHEQPSHYFCLSEQREVQRQIWVLHFQGWVVGILLLRTPHLVSRWVLPSGPRSSEAQKKNKKIIWIFLMLCFPPFSINKLKRVIWG